MRVPVTVWALAILASPAMALDIRIDFKQYAANPPGDWNTINATPTNLPVKDYLTGDTADGVLFTMSTSSYSWTFANATGAWNTANPGPAWLDDQKLAAMDYANLGWNLTGYLTFDGLDPDQVYTIELIASRNAAQADAEYRIGNEVIMFNPQTHGYVNGKWMTWTDISPDATGKISIQCGKLGSHSYNVYVNALRLTPEPATVALLVLGGLGMIRRKL